MAAIMNCAMNNTAVKSIITSTSKSIAVYRNDKRVPAEGLSAYTRWYSYSERFNNDPTITGPGGKMKVISGKTGGEDIPSSCFVTTAINSKTGEQYICVVIGRINMSGTKVSEEVSTSDTEKIYAEYAYN